MSDDNASLARQLEDLGVSWFRVGTPMRLLIAAVCRRLRADGAVHNWAEQETDTA